MSKIPIYLFFALIIPTAIQASENPDLLNLESKASTPRTECAGLWEKAPKTETSTGRSSALKADGLAKSAWIKQCIEKLLANGLNQPPKPSDDSKAAASASSVKNLTNSPLLPKDYKFSPEEELDLHGKRVNRAKELITAFLENASKLGKKFVLIITGKGQHSKNVEYLSDGTEVGLIKYNFLLWTQENVFKKYIKEISYTHGVHGADGAFYVRLNP